MDGWVVGWVDSTYVGGQIFCQGIHVLFSHAHACTSLTLGASLPMLSEGYVPVMAAVPPSPSLHKHTSTGAHAEAPCSGARLPTPAPSSVHTLVRAPTHSAQLTGRGQTIHVDRKQQVVRNIKPLLLASRFNPLQKKNLILSRPVVEAPSGAHNRFRCTFHEETGVTLRHPCSFFSDFLLVINQPEATCSFEPFT